MTFAFKKWSISGSTMAWEKKTRIQYAGAHTCIFSTKNVQYASFATLGIDTTSPSRDNILFSWCWKKDQRHQGKWCLCKLIELSLPLSSWIWMFSPSLLKCRNIQLTLTFSLCIYSMLFVLQWRAAERTSWILIFDLISQEGCCNSCSKWKWEKRMVMTPENFKGWHQKF